MELVAYLRNAAIGQLKLPTLGNTVFIFWKHILHTGAFPTKQVMKRKLPYLKKAVEYEEESQLPQCLPT